MSKTKVKAKSIGIVGNNARVEGGINYYIRLATSRLSIVLLGGILLLVAVIALANTPAARNTLQTWRLVATNTPTITLSPTSTPTSTPTPISTPTPTPTIIPTLTPTPTPTPLPFPPEAEGEVLIVIAKFYHTEGIVDAAIHSEIKHAIENEAQTLDFTDLRVEVAPDCFEADERDRARALGDRYNASLVIWGADTGVRVSANFYNRKQPASKAADVQIEETARTMIAAPSEYAEFITRDLPDQLTFLSLFAIGQSYYATGAYSTSAQTIEAAVARLGDTSIEGAAEAYFRLGWLYSEPLANVDEALANYNHALEFNPNDAETYNNRGVIYARKSEYNEALENFARALELAPTLVETYVARGIFYYTTGDYEAALIDITHALEIKPDYAEAYRNRGIVYAGLNEYAKALADYTRVIEFTPDDAWGYNKRGNIYYDLGKYAEALDDFTRAIELTPNDAWLHSKRGSTYYYLNAYIEALADFTQAIALKPDDAGMYSNRGLTHDAMGMHAKAITDFTHAISLDPDNTEMYSKRGTSYYYAGKYERAMADYTYAIEHNFATADIYYNRGLTYVNMEEYTKALTDFTRVLGFSSDYADDAYYYGAIAYSRLGYTSNACNWLQNALALTPNWRDYAHTDPNFDTIRDTSCFQILMNEDAP